MKNLKIDVKINSNIFIQKARITQSVECCANNAVVTGSIPVTSIFSNY